MIYVLTAIIFLTMFTVLVAVHEWGHYLAARMFKMGVKEFSVGFGNPILKTWKRKKFIIDEGDTGGETEFNIRPIPLGGYVKIWGMEPQPDGSEINVHGGFYSKPQWQRIVVLFAGPLFSILFGVFLLTAVFSTIGEERGSNQVKALQVGKPAEKAGIKPGDRIVQVNDQKIKELTDAMTAIRSSQEQVKIIVDRNGQMLEFAFPTVMSPEPRPILDKDGLPTGEMKKVPIVGIEFGSERVRISFAEAFSDSVRLPVIAAQRLIYKMSAPKELIEESNGVVGMAVITKNIVENQIIDVLQWCGLLSISIGIFNLVPIGMLDGGQIAIAIVEMFRGGKRLSYKLQNALMTFGMFFMLFLFIVVTQKDVRQFLLPQPKAEPEVSKDK